MITWTGIISAEDAEKQDVAPGETELGEDVAAEQVRAGP